MIEPYHRDNFITIYHSDCRDVLPQLGRFDLLLTDPPYAVEYNANWWWSLDKWNRAAGFVQNDNRKEWKGVWWFFLGNVTYVWRAGKYTSETQTVLQALVLCGCAQIVRVKSAFAISRDHYRFKQELCWYSGRKNATADWPVRRAYHTIWKIDNNTFQGTSGNGKHTGHGTQKPVECMQRPIRNHEGGVYDPFVESGTAIVAAQNESRRCYAIDIDPAYVAVSLRRLSDIGLEAKRAHQPHAS